MGSSELNFLNFVELSISNKNAVQFQCTNWADTGQSLAASFLKTTQPSALYVIVHSQAFEIVSNLAHTPREFVFLIAFIKQAGTLLDAIPLASQIQVINIPGAMPDPELASNGKTEQDDLPKNSVHEDSRRVSYEGITNLVSLAITPFFDFVAQGEPTSTASASLAQARKKFGELALSLRHLQNRIQVPDLLSAIPPHVREVLSDSDSSQDSTVVTNLELLNDLSRIVNTWIQQIQSLTHLPENISEGNSLQDEVQFWDLLESSLTSLREQVLQPEVKCAIEILNAAKRFQITLAFQNNLGISELLAETRIYNELLKDIPISELATTKDISRNGPQSIEKLESIIITLFSHVKNWKGLNSLPLTRMIALVELLVEEIASNLVEVLVSLDLAGMVYNQFFAITSELLPRIFETVENNVKFMVNSLRELMRKRQDKFMIVKIETPLIFIVKERISCLKGLRKKHDDLIQALSCLDGFDSNIQHITLAYSKQIAPSNPFDFTKQGISLWENSQRLYVDVFSKVLDNLSAIINRRLDQNETFIEYLRLFDQLLRNSGDSLSAFILPFIDDRHKLAVLDVASSDIDNLLSISNQFLSTNEEDCNFALIRAELSLKTKTDFYLENLRRVLGSNWNSYSVGSKIESKLASHNHKMNLSSILENWIKFTTSRLEKVHVSGNLLKIQGSTEDGNLNLVVNSDPIMSTLVEQEEELLAFGFEIPPALRISLERHKTIQPLTNSLIEHINLFEDVVFGVCTESEFGIKFGFLFEAQKLKIFDLLKEVFQITWSQIVLEVNLTNDDKGFSDVMDVESSGLNQLGLLLENIHHFHSLVNATQKIYDRLYGVHIPEIAACSFTAEEVSKVVACLHEDISSNIGEQFQDIEHFMNIVNQDIESTIVKKCKVELGKISAVISGTLDASTSSTTVTSHSIILENDSFVITPPLESSKLAWVDDVNRVLQLIEQSGHAHSSGMRSVSSSKLCITLLNEIAEAMSIIEFAFSEAQEYFSRWIALQKLFSEETQLDLIYFPSDASFDVCLHSVEKILRLKELFDNCGGRFRINGVMGISFLSVETQVKRRFSIIQANLLHSLAEKMHQTSRICSEELSAAQKHLFKTTVVDQSMHSALNSVEDIYSYRSKAAGWDELVASLGRCQLYLYRQSVPSTDAWIHVEQVESQLSNVKGLILKGLEKIEANFDSLSLKLSSKWSEVQDSLSILRKEWEEKKPISATMQPSSALAGVAKYKSKANDLRAQIKSLLHIASCLKLELETSKDLDFLDYEIDELKNVWTSIQDLWNALESIMKSRWSDFHVRGLKEQLSKISSRCDDCPIAIRQYAAFTSLQSSIKGYLRNLPILAELKSEAMKERHWEQIFKLTNSQHRDSDPIIIRDVLGVNYQMHEGVIRNVLEKANGEQLVQESLDKISEEWSFITFETFAYAGKCRLIKNWSFLFDQCSTNLGTLSSIKNSLFHGQFESKRVELETRLKNLADLFNTWVEVQRQWVYLDGVFDSNGEIKSSLPLESSRFSNVSFEFLSLLKKVSTFDHVIDVLSVKGLHQTMLKLSDSLTRTIKGLSDYLDQQRDRFPRFFFIGNEDLLELLGSNNDESQINRHIKRMFPGIASVSINRESSQIESVVSPQGEKISLKSPISLIKYRSLAEWLSVLETEVQLTLSRSICNITALVQDTCSQKSSLTDLSLREILCESPHQVLIVAFQVYFSFRIHEVIESQDFDGVIEFYTDLMAKLTVMASKSDGYVMESKIRCLIIESMHHRDVFENLRCASITDQNFIVSSEQLFFCYPNDDNPLKRLRIKQGHFEFTYGFEYLGVVERLAITPLVNKCYLTMTQALAQKLGGCPFGPAGTGKTECIKALGQNLGRVVMVFCCDESFDFPSMGRILLGLCKVGCWGCFDEFNRLEKKILSSLSTQIESIETGLRNSESVLVANKQIEVHDETGIFVTMNPEYAGRNELPENLKMLFRGVSMNQPDEIKISEVILTSHGFKHARKLSGILVPFFQQLKSSLSSQIHYDFGLRALKSILKNAGAKKMLLTAEMPESNEFSAELSILLESLLEVLCPRLVKSDERIFEKILAKHNLVATDRLGDHSELLARLEEHLESKGLSPTTEVLQKALQIYQSQQSHHGMILVGTAGSGKSATMNLVLSSLTELDGKSFQKISMDSKVLTKDSLYGRLDPITRDWTDGLLTKVLRQISANLKGEMERRTWIVFDGDIDPEWAENLNSLLDDNKLLTLPNGERLELPPNVRIVFEVLNLDYATPATVSRCAMIWFDSTIVNMNSLWNHHLFLLRQFFKEHLDTDTWMKMTNSRVLVDRIVDLLASANFEIKLEKMYAFASKLNHIMEGSLHRMLTGLFVHLKIHITDLLISVESDKESANLETFTDKAFALSLIWGFVGDCPFDERQEFQRHMEKIGILSGMDIPSDIIHCDISYPDFEWKPRTESIDLVDLEPHHVLDLGTIVPTVDTVMHESLIHGIINKHSPLILCGPPGSGKTMTFLKALRNSSNLELISLNFSKDTSPESLVSTMEQHCEYKTTNEGVELSPKVDGKWAVVFCDEINLPAEDMYGTQRVISFMRQLVEFSGFWRPNDLTWVTLRNIQFVGACNSPNDPGRNKLTERFMRHVTLVLVDYPGSHALKQIYTSFNKATLKCAPDMRSFSDALTSSMIDVYDATRSHFTSKKQSHYIYSPRELTRWCRGILETLKDVPYSDILELLRLWYHEGLRLFYDRLVDDTERVWCRDLFWSVAAKNFPHINLEIALKGPIFFSTWLTGQYESVSEDELSSFVNERLRVFSEEEMEYDLILFEDLLDHALRIDRALRQHQGHMILVGPSTSGKTCLTKFVTWMNGMKLVQLKVHSNYSVAEFEQSLRDLLICCARGEQLCFLIDESCVLEASFIERMNSLLANSEIPGLFEGDDLESLMKLCAAEASAQGQILDTDDEIYEWFTRQISENLHVAFTISELSSEKSPQIHSSPALFNRCVMSWMGDWSDVTLKKVAETSLSEVPLDQSSFTIPETYVSLVDREAKSFRDVVVDTFVFIHRSNTDIDSLVVPKQFLEFTKYFQRLFNEGQHDLEENQRHTNIGLDKLRETVLEVSQMKKVLSEKTQILQLKDNEARKMLNKMIVDQNESERKREFSVDTKAELTKQEAEIQSRRLAVMEDLAYAEPAVLEAQQGVQNIKKQHLTELRSMSNPPASIKLALESVCVLLGYQVASWRDVQLVVRQDDFITKIVNFDNEKQLSSELRSYMKEVYLSRSDFNFEAIHRASKACGPLFQWVVAQIRYSEILVKIGPLREQVKVLEAYAVKSRSQLIAIAEMISELEESIESYKNQYSEVIREAERVKTEMRTIEEKVNRSLKLIENLTKERQRWLDSVKFFQKERERLVGNSILGSAFMAYCGDLNQKARQDLISCWRKRLSESHIPFETSMTLASILTTNAQKNVWLRGGLSEDDVFIENFAIKSRCEFPFIIDPTGDVLQVVTNMLGKDLVVTSFLSESFVKTMEDALRFGGTVLVQNAEFYNPILDSVLRKEITNAGGRRLVHFGTRSLILLDNFRLMLHTRDPRVVLSPFVKARTAVLNFTITKSNLENRVLNVALEHYDPVLESKRVELVALQSEFSSRLLELRKVLLATLNETSGTILENDHVIESLEKIEKETSNIAEKIAQSETVMTSVDEVRLLYDGVASHLKNIFEVVKLLTETNKFYNFSFDGFIRIFESVLLEVGKSIDFEQIILMVYAAVYRRLAPTLRTVDKSLFKLSLAISYFCAKSNSPVKAGFIKTLRLLSNDGHKSEQSLDVSSHLVEKEPENLAADLENFLTYCKHNEDLSTIFKCVEEINEGGSANIRDKLINDLCASVFGKMSTSSLQLDDWVLQTSGPYIFSTSESYDVTYQIEHSARQAQKELVKISMGTKEGVKLANETIDIAAKKGFWVLIQNVQLSSSWLTCVREKLQNQTISDGFRLFLTCGLDAENIPNELVNISSVMTIDLQPHWKKMLLDTFVSLIEANVSLPELQAYFLLSWYHTIIQERLKYVPISFQRSYDINESDAEAARFMIAKLFSDAKSRDGASNEVSWSEIAYRVGEIIYGGKIPVEEDSQYCAELAKKIFHADSHRPDFNLVENEQAKLSGMKLVAPDAGTIAEFQKWINDLPETIPLEWLGLMGDVSTQAKEEQAISVLHRASNLLEMAI